MIKLWLWPVMLAMLTATGLVSGLVSDGPGDIWAWIGLGIPVMSGVYYGLLRRQKN